MPKNIHALDIEIGFAGSILVFQWRKNVKRIILGEVEFINSIERIHIRERFSKPLVNKFKTKRLIPVILEQVLNSPSKSVDTFQNLCRKFNSHSNSNVIQVCQMPYDCEKIKISKIDSTLPFPINPQQISSVQSK